MTNPPGLGPHTVGQRVVVRRLVRGETGPTGGPAFTDLLGVMETWADGVTTIRDAEGAVTAIAVGDIVSGKPVPPRPSVRHRVSAEEAELRADAAWRARETERLGDWLLRASGGYSSRANAALAVGDPGTGIGEAAGRVRSFYAARDLPAWAQVVVGSDVHHALETAGWDLARPGEADTLFQVASVAQARRVVRRTLPDVVPPVTLTPTCTPAWLADDTRALSHGDVAVGVLEGSAEVGFAAVEVDGLVVAKGRVARGGETDDWAGITNVWVSPERRRQGLGTVVVGALLAWAAERGVTTAYLQTRGDNPPALAAYDRLGFVTHHAYRYLTAPAA